ncbi:adenylyl cyclase [Buttiauxella brennerae ATCC 51605]|uniref:diguanylate cyclase n=1 Tax=Buttiauxella brennerae ATCC 51605 TaxID=1354251 RepID=A0A1B7ILG4_9ENTR|nr:GGDEF domain-containing protein [Buttiauxella brennerae]OAT30402.1 adenylyl cyclase [Buttiauxella brennerae ATCC 51605]
MNYDDAIDEERRKMVSLSGAWFIIVTLTLSSFVLFYSYFLDDNQHITANSYSKYFALTYILFIGTLWVVRTLNPFYLDKNWMRNASILIFINGIIWGGIVFCYVMESRLLGPVFLCVIILFCGIVSGYSLTLIGIYSLPIFSSLLISTYLKDGLLHSLYMCIILSGVWFIIKTSDSLIKKRINKEIATSLILEKKAFNACHNAQIDYLTGVFNRRGFEVEFKKAVSECVIEQKPFAIILVDIDYFKKINDTFGHVAGDECLIAVADKIQKCLKFFVSSISRYGGDEFIIIVNEATSEKVEMICNNIKNSINENSLKSIGDKCISVTQGAAICDNARSVNDIISCADSALYEAKQNGRNCYQVVE